VRGRFGAPMARARKDHCNIANGPRVTRVQPLTVAASLFLTRSAKRTSLLKQRSLLALNIAEAEQKAFKVSVMELRKAPAALAKRDSLAGCAQRPRSGLGH
jgi:hypothetical protein